LYGSEAVRQSTNIDSGNHEKFPKLPDGSRDLDKSWSYIQTWKELEEVLKTGKTKAIGVANFSKPYLEKLLPQVEIVPAVNQIENHPLLPQQEIVDFCKEKGIHVTAYSPFGSTGSPLFSDETVAALAKKYQVGSGNILLSYHSSSFVDHSKGIDC
jgi:glycerol 2-dehydrogenase (NADP+)